MSEEAGPPTLLSQLSRALTDAARYNRQDQAAPVAVLWTDHDSEWESLIPILLLREQLPLFILGPYNLETRAGPAYWLRCIVDRSLPASGLDDGAVPVLYLPGYSRQDVRSVDACGPEIRPLVELQYRGVLWSQKNGRDWTVAAFLQNMESGLGVEVASDGATRQALVLALTKLANEPVARIRREAPIRAPYLYGLLNPDEVKKILEWIDDPDRVKASMNAEAWKAFVATCRSRYSFDPEKDSVISVARMLGQRDGAMAKVWDRLAESPGSYLGLPGALRQARPAARTLFDAPDAWPQDNEEAEAQLRNALVALGSVDAGTARAEIHKLEKEHGPRRSSLWGKLGQAPLAAALEHLTIAAEATRQALVGANVEALIHSYTDCGWRADLSALDALAKVDSNADLAAVSTALRTYYRPWLDDAARTLQAAVGASSRETVYRASPPVVAEIGTCILFSDGLRYDVGQRLKDLLQSASLECELSAGLAALPTVTATAKTSICPAAGIFGPSAHGFDASLAAKATTVTVTVMRRELENLGYQILQGNDLGDPNGRAWTELGNLDTRGHSEGLSLARRIEEELRMIKERISALLERGWQHVIVVTDHGWLLVPGGLPKAELPEHLTETRKGRCARLKDGAVTEFRTVPWRWAPSVRIAVAPGIHCFEAGKEYEHGGVSPQECVVPILTIKAPRSVAACEIESVSWAGLRCRVQVSGAASGFKLDIRSKGDPLVSVVEGGAKVVTDDGMATLMAKDDYEGRAGLVVALGPGDKVLAELPTTIGA